MRVDACLGIGIIRYSIDLYAHRKKTSHMFNVKITPLDNASGGQTLTDGDRFHFKSRVFRSRTLSINSNF